MSLQVAALVVAAGSGSRVGGAVPKQFIEVAGHPLLVHALFPFEAHPLVRTITVVLPAAQVQEWGDLLATRYGILKVTSVVAGGLHRRDSVRLGMEAAIGEGGEDRLVAVHDGARPNFSADLLDRLFAAAEEHGAAVPVLPALDTAVTTSDGEWWDETADRTSLRLVQTPQVFRAELLRQAHREVTDPMTTDDGQLVRALGHQVRLVSGDRDNLKVTTPEDLVVYETLVQGRTES